MEKIHIVLTVVIALLITSVAYIAYDATRTAEIEIPQAEAGAQLQTPPEPNASLIAEPPAAAGVDFDLAKSIFAWGEAGEEITGTIVFIDYANGVVYFTESESGDLYYTVIEDFSELQLDGRPATLESYKIGMPLTVRWIEEETEEAQI